MFFVRFLIHLRNTASVFKGFVIAFQKQGECFLTNHETILTHRSLTPPENVALFESRVVSISKQF